MWCSVPNVLFQWEIFIKIRKFCFLLNTDCAIFEISPNYLYTSALNTSSIIYTYQIFNSVMTATMVDSKSKEKSIDNSIMKYVSLIALTLQNALSAIAVRHGRTRVEKKDLFYSSTGKFYKIFQEITRKLLWLLPITQYFFSCFCSAVIMFEVSKLVVCLVIVFFEEGRSLEKFGQALYQTIIKNKIDTLKVCVPSVLYVIQNNLLYVAASHLDAATYQVFFILFIKFTLMTTKRTYNTFI